MNNRDRTVMSKESFLYDILNYALEYPELYAYNYFIPLERMREFFENCQKTISDTLSKEESAESKTQIHQLTNKACKVILKASLGVIIKLYASTCLTAKEVLILGNNLQQIYTTKDVVRLFEFYKHLATYNDFVDNPDLEELKAIAKTHHRKLYKIIKNETVADLTETIHRVIKREIHQFVKQCDDGSDLRVKTLPYQDILSASRIPSSRKTDFLCIFGTPGEACNYFKFCCNNRASRIEKLQTMKAPDMILQNERRILEEYQFLRECAEVTYQQQNTPDGLIRKAETFFRELAQKYRPVEGQNC